MKPLCVLMAVAALAVAEDYDAAAPSNQRPMLGIEMSPVPSHIQEREGINAHQGVLVQSTYPGTAAESMALQRGDVVLQVNGAPIGSMTDLRNEVGLTAVGDPIQVRVSRNGQVMDLGSQVREWPASVPYEKLDAAGERRFREWQDRRKQRQAEDLARINREAEAMKRELRGEDNGPAGRRGRGAGGAAGSSASGGVAVPAVRFHLVIAASARDADPTSVADPGPLAPLALPVGLPAEGPWRITARLSTF
jgi:hypothetical protein